MKTNSWLLLSAALCSPCLNAQVSLPLATTGPVVVETGPHHRVWQTVDVGLDESGRQVATTNSYTELTTGLNFWNPVASRWEESKAQFQITKDGNAIATNGQHKVILAPNINSGGSVDLLTPDEKRFLSNPMGLSFYDAATGTNVLIAEVKDCIGQFIPPNVIFYDDAFTDIKGAIRYTYTKGGLEQDILIYNGLGSPTDYGMNPATSLLEMYSEFHTWSTPRKLTVVTPDNLIDETLDFGLMAISRGRAFGLDAPEPSVPVVKAWETISGRTFLIESIPYLAAKPYLDNLQADASTPTHAKVMKNIVADRKGLLATEGMRSRTRAKEVASIKPGRVNKDKGFVMDYVTLNTSQTNYIFKGDNTYYITDNVYLSGATIIEAGTVIKYSTSANASVWINDSVDCQTTAYRPAVFTAMDDNTVGEPISGSTGAPTKAGYGFYGLVINYGPSYGTTLSNLRFSFLRHALNENRWSTNTLSHAQILKCDRAIMVYSSCDFTGHNVLIDQAATAVDHGSGIARGENWTVHEVTNLKREAYGTNTMYLTNSLLVGVTNLPGTTNSFVSVNSVIFTNDQPSFFQTVGAGSHYLAANSPYRNAGTTNVNAVLLADLNKKTTYPPIILTNDFTVSTTLSPQAQRDTDTPDIGFHYDPLDYCFSGLNLTNATLTLTNGVAIGVYGIKGVTMRTGGKFVSEGLPGTQMNRLVRYQAVQEQPVLWGSTNSSMPLIFNSTALPSVTLRFTDVSLLADTTGHRVLFDSAGSGASPLAISHCQLRGVYELFPDQANTSGMLMIWTNNFMERCTFTFTQSDLYYPFTLYLYNNLFHFGTNSFTTTSNSPAWTVKDNLFDCDSLTKSGAPSFTVGNNGYRSGLTSLGGSGNKTGLVPDYQTGPLGNFYYPTSGSSTSLTNLFDTGSRSAPTAGLYHFTTRSDLAKETTSTVDIGFHYVATDANGVPIDTDGDGIPDYLEDRNGNGTTESGETDWQNPYGASDLGLRVWITEPKSNSNIP